MRDCPKCQATVDGESCPVCGYTEGRGKGKAAPVDPDRGRCEHSDGTTRCRSVGVWSPANNGIGPWYCRQHGRQSGGGLERMVLPPINALRAALAGRQPGEDDA